MKNINKRLNLKFDEYQWIIKNYSKNHGHNLQNGVLILGRLILFSNVQINKI
jgi:hypothetical protein